MSEEKKNIMGLNKKECILSIRIFKGKYDDIIEYNTKQYNRIQYNTIQYNTII